jgi:hypothetical protein
VYETVGLVQVGEDEGQPREQNLNEEEQRAVGGIWLNHLHDQLQPLADVSWKQFGLWNYRFLEYYGVTSNLNLV